MKKIGNGRALLFLLVLAAGLTGWIFRADRAQETLFDGRTFSAEEQVCLLRDIREVSQGHYRFCFYVVEDCGPLTLSLIHLPSFFLSVNGERVYEYREEEGYRRIVNCEIGELKPGKVILDLETEAISRDANLYLGNEAAVARLASANQIGQALAMGLLFGVAIYGMTLYWNKSSEEYLMVFFVYTSMLMIWGLCQQEFSGLAIPGDLFVVLRSFFSSLTILQSIHVSVTLMKQETGRPFSVIFSWYGSLAVSFLYMLLRLWIPAAGAVASALLFFTSGAMAVFVCLHSGRESRALMIGFSVTQCLRILSWMADRGSFADTIYFNYFRTVPIFDLPFVIGCMVTINIRFAGKFKEAEELVRELDRKVEERTEELREQQRKKRQFMIRIFHDLRSPIFILQGHMELMPAETGEARENLDIMKDKLSFLARMTEDLFLLTKLEENKVLFCEDSVDMRKLVRELGASCRLACEQEKIRLSVEAETEAIVIGDRIRLEQALMNLLVNGIHYTPEGGELALSLRKNKGRVEVRVRDSGPGIEPEDIPKIFQQYYHKDRSGKSASTGLGLSIAQEIIRYHGGTLTVESELGQGSVFLASLPEAEFFS
ncbi:MAG: hypothetical protein HFI93_07560 [Lachnospiraceae bacterium]|nr:hypothetical protein [Lachnospiraceae bacterium]